MKFYYPILMLFVFNNISFAQKGIEYDKVCYCSGNETPHSIVSYDNNLQILLALSDGLSTDAIEEQKIPYTESQLKLLRLFGLIDKKNGEYYTKIQILDTIQTIELRKYSKLISNEIFPFIENDIKQLVRHLKTTFDSRNEFSILFSYVFDGLIWREFEGMELIQSNKNDDNILTWSGHFWMIPFPRESKCGTNTLSKKSTTLYVTNGIPWKYIKPLYENDFLTEQMLLDINDTGKINASDVLSTFAEYTIFDAKGLIQVPIIYENRDNEIYKMASILAQKLSKKILETISISSLVDKYGFKDKETAFIVFYHELMWDLMQLVEDTGIVQRPIILNTSEDVSISEMSDLIFFVVSN